MSDEHKNHASSSEPQNESDPVALLKKIQQHLVFLEKKIDTLIGQQSPGNSQGNNNPGNSFKRNFSRPPRPFGHPHGGGRGKPSHRPGPGGPPREHRSFEGAPRGDSPGFFRKKKPFFRGGKH